MRKILFDRNSPELQLLIQLIEIQDHRHLICWVHDCSQKALNDFERGYPQETRLKDAHLATIQWATGIIKMPQAERFALNCHAVAKEIPLDPIGRAYAHSMGHVVGTVHVETHAMGFVIYYLTGVAHVVNYNKELIQREIRWLFDRLNFWSTQSLDSYTWAPFLMRSNQPNKEKLWNEKQREQKTKDAKKV